MYVNIHTMVMFWNMRNIDLNCIAWYRLQPVLSSIFQEIKSVMITSSFLTRSGLAWISRKKLGLKSDFFFFIPRNSRARSQNFSRNVLLTPLEISFAFLFCPQCFCSNNCRVEQTVYLDLQIKISNVSQNAIKPSRGGRKNNENLREDLCKILRVGECRFGTCWYPGHSSGPR